MSTLRKVKRLFGKMALKWMKDLKKKKKKGKQSFFWRAKECGNKNNNNVVG